MDNYNLLKKYDTLSIDDTGNEIEDAFNWIYVKHKGNKNSGLAVIQEEGTIKFYSNGEENDMTVSKDEFNKSFIIERIVDHWGNEIKEAKEILKKNNNKIFRMVTYLKSFC